jgi:signal recognition particle subunit SRP54
VQEYIVLHLNEDAVPKDAQPKMAKRLQEGKFSLRDMYEQFQSMLKMGPLDQVQSSLKFTYSEVIDMLPDTGLNHLLKGGSGEAGHQKIKNYMTIMDSMTDQGMNSLVSPHAFFRT